MIIICVIKAYGGGGGGGGNDVDGGQRVVYQCNYTWSGPCCSNKQQTYKDDTRLFQ